VSSRLKPLSDASAELDAVNRFLTASVPATNRCARLLGALDSAKPTPAAIAPPWKECQGHLKAVASVPETTLKGVSDDAIRLRLMEVQGLIRDAETEIDRTITAADWADVRAQVRAVNQSLNAVLFISGVEVTRFKAVTDGLVQWANNPAGKMPAPNTDMFMTESQQALNDARKVIPRKTK
jgi:hypothetical protein